MSIDKFATKLGAVISRRIEADQLVLPTLPAVALQVQEILKDPEAGMKEVAIALEKDPLLAARALRMATSAAFAASGKKLVLQEALARLGAKNIKALLVEAAAQNIFVSRNRKIDAQLKVMWKHSVAVGVAARDLLALCGSTDAESAYLPGLLHDIGKPVVATLLLELERQVIDADRDKWIDSGDWLEVVATLHRTVGVKLAERWELPPNIIGCIKESQDFDPAGGASVVNAVCFANALAKKLGLYAGAVDAAENAALLASGLTVLGLSEEKLGTLTKGLQGQVSSLYV